MRVVVLAFAVLLAACDGSAGSPGPAGPRGEPAPMPTPPPVVLCPRLFFTEGRAGTVYFENATPAQHASDFTWDVTGVGFGQQLAERWTWTFAVASPATTFTLSTFDPWTGTLIASASAAVSTSPAAAGAGTTPRVLFVGDSFTASGLYTQALLDIAAGDTMKLELVGTLGSGTNRYEGRAGWTVASYATGYSDVSGLSNPFWLGGRVDFPGYLAANALPTPDWAFILLGTNDVFWADSDAAAIATAAAAFNRLDVLLESIRAAGPNVRVGLMTPPPPTSDEDLWGASYGSGQTRWRFKRNILLWDQELVARYAGREAARVYIVPTHLGIDTAANMANGVHPSPAGYQQLAEVVWAFLKAAGAPP